MKPQIYADKVRVFLFILLILTVPVYIFDQEFRSVQNGIEYAEMTRQIDNQPVRMNLLRLDLTKVRLDVVHAMDAAIGTETTSSIATRHGAIAAINAGFFRLDKSIFAGDAAGVLMIDNQLLSESQNGRVALMIANEAKQTKVFIERANISKTISVKGKDFIVGINRARGENDLVIFTENFNRTTLTDNNGTEFIVRIKKIAQIYDGKGSNKIPENGYVLSASGKKRDELLSLLKIGTKINLTSRHSSPVEMMPTLAFGQSEDVIGGVPQLIKNGKIEI